MSEQTTYEQSSSTTSNKPAQDRSASENIRELTEAGKQLLEAGRQMTENLSELSDRVEHAKNVSSDVLTSPWMFAGGAIAAGLLILLVSGRD